jgi:hypothetical protein
VLGGQYSCPEFVEGADAGAGEREAGGGGGAAEEAHTVAEDCGA